jgi:hypothetical protein
MAFRPDMQTEKYYFMVQSTKNCVFKFFRYFVES